MNAVSHLSSKSIVFFSMLLLSVFTHFWGKCKTERRLFDLWREPMHVSVGLLISWCRWVFPSPFHFFQISHGLELWLFVDLVVVVALWVLMIWVRVSEQSVLVLASKSLPRRFLLWGSRCYMQGLFNQLTFYLKPLMEGYDLPIQMIKTVHLCAPSANRQKRKKGKQICWH